MQSPLITPKEECLESLKLPDYVWITHAHILNKKNLHIEVLDGASLIYFESLQQEKCLVHVSNNTQHSNVYSVYVQPRFFQCVFPQKWIDDIAVSEIKYKIRKSAGVL